MTTAIDTNVIVALWDRETTLNSAAQSALDAALGRGGLVVAAPVFAELMACPGRDQAFLDMFFRDAGIVAHWDLDEAIWRRAGGSVPGLRRPPQKARRSRAAPHPRRLRDRRTRH